tara:strand:+ start:183 stop:404 length:222 start_codon:yes stop_codon:yes gene_type:complete
LPEWCIRLHGVDRADRVMDPFVGLGSTSIACVELGVNFVGVEMDRNYLEEAIARTRAALKTRRKRARLTRNLR